MTNDNQSDSPTSLSWGKHCPRGLTSFDQLTMWSTERRPNGDRDGCTMSADPLLSKTIPRTPLGLSFMVHSTTTMMEKNDSQKTPTPIPIASKPSLPQVPVRRRRRTTKHIRLHNSNNMNNTLRHCPLLIESRPLPLLGNRPRATVPLDSMKGLLMCRLPDDSSKDRQTRAALAATSRSLAESMQYHFIPRLALIPSIHNPTGSTNTV